MSRKANPTVVGVFVVVAVALFVAAVIIFGKGELFKQTQEWVLYFDGSIKGLSSGSAVVFQGVRIGEVKDIRVHITKEGDVSTPVIMELNSSLMDFEDEEANLKKKFAHTWQMIERGLRAQLQTQSLITGQLLIQLDFHPEKEARFVAPEGTAFQEMPTVPSTVQELSKTLENLPLEDIIDNIASITKNLNDLIESPELSNGLMALAETLKKSGSIMAKIEEQITPISLEAQAVMKSTKNLLDDNSGKLSSLLKDLEETSQTTRKSVVKITEDMDSTKIKVDDELSHFLETATQATEHAGDMISDQSLFRHELNKTLEEVNATLRAIRLLAEYMEQYPESVIRGKKE